MRSVLVAIGLGATACGQISFGDPIDAGMPVADTGPKDMGVVVPDAGPVDLGCTPATRPAIPSAWPFAATKTGYLENFYNGLPSPRGCGLGGCHGPDMANGYQPDNKPLIPRDPPDLDPPGVLDQAMADLWATVTPENAPPLIRVHDPDSPDFVDTGFELEPEEITYLTAFIQKGYQCAWKDYTPPGGDAGVADTGAGDGGLGDASASDAAAPADSGATGAPICPITVDTSYCTN